MTTITDRECHVGVRSRAVWWAKHEKNNKVRHNNIMTQIASLFVVATIFISLRTLVSTILLSGRGGGLYTRDKTTYDAGT